MHSFICSGRAELSPAFPAVHGLHASRANHARHGQSVSVLLQPTCTCLLFQMDFYLVPPRTRFRACRPFNLSLSESPWPATAAAVPFTHITVAPHRATAAFSGPASCHASASSSWRCGRKTRTLAYVWCHIVVRLVVFSMTMKIAMFALCFRSSLELHDASRGVHESAVSRLSCLRLSRRNAFCSRPVCSAHVAL